MKPSVLQYDDWETCPNCGVRMPPRRLKDGRCTDEKWCAEAAAERTARLTSTSEAPPQPLTGRVSMPLTRTLAGQGAGALEQQLAPKAQK